MYVIYNHHWYSTVWHRPPWNPYTVFLPGPVWGTGGFGRYYEETWNRLVLLK